MAHDALAAAQADLERGRVAAAEARLRHLLAEEPRHPRALHLLGVVLHRRGESEAAMSVLRAAAAAAPLAAEPRCHLAEVLRTSGRPQEAEAAACEALALQPGWAAALNNLALALQDQGRLAEAEQVLREAVEADAAYARAPFNLGNVLRAQGRLEDAASWLRQALTLRPDYPTASRALGLVLEDLGDLAGAEECLRRALELAPDDVALQNAYGGVAVRSGAAYQMRFELTAAESAYGRAVAVDPGNAEAWAGLMACRAQLCDWRERTNGIERVRRALHQRLAAGEPAPISPSAAMVLGLSAAEQLAIARDAAERMLSPLRSRAAPARHDSDDRRPLRLAYLSSDFRDNALAHLTRGLYGLHDRRRFTVHAYSLGADDGSEYRRGIAEDCDHFVDLAAIAPEEAAERIRADGIDLLVDLTGFAAGGRPAILAQRPAPLQIVYLYPGTLGGVFTDYFIGDATVTPLAQQPSFGEALVLLPHCYQINDHRQPIAARRFDRASQGLPDDAFVFCSFNNHWKIEPVIWRVWMGILQRVAGSVLWLQDMAAAARHNLRREAAAHGVHDDRLVFAPHLPKPEHLARCALADLFLDTWICNAHTTASDALWSGVPLLTGLGDHLPARVAASLLRAVGLDEMVMADLGAYEEQAVELARDRDGLAALRARLARARENAPLFDTPRSVAHLEAVYDAMWERHRLGLLPAPLLIGSDGVARAAAAPVGEA